MEKMEAREREQKEQEAQKKLFTGLKFYLNREVPRESLAFIIRWVRSAVKLHQGCKINIACNDCYQLKLTF